MGTIEVAKVLHGRPGGPPNPHTWTVQVEEVSLWRIATDRAWHAALHASGICCGRHFWRFIPYTDVLGFRLLTWLWIDNGHKHVRYRIEVSDDWARGHVPEFWAEMHDLWAEEDAAQVQ